MMARSRVWMWVGMSAAVTLLLGGGLLLAYLAKPSPQGASSPSASPTTTAPPRATVVPVPTGLGTDAVDHLKDTTESADGLEISFPSTEADPSLGTYIETFLVGQRRAASEGETTAAVAATWDIVAAAGPYLGVVVDSTATIADKPPHREAITVYSDIKAQRTLAGQELLTTDGRHAAAREVVAAARGANLTDGESDDDQLVDTLMQAPNGLGDVRLDPAGRLTFVVSPGVLAPSDKGPLAIQLDDDLTAQVLSKEGQDIRAAISAQTPFVGLPAPKKPAVDCTQVSCIALTFDDGPGPYTQKLLAQLRDADVPATFFMVGRSVKAMPEVAKAVAEAGHTIGNHSLSHPQLTKLSDAKVTEQLGVTREAIKEATGVDATLVRPPYGAQDARVMDLMRSRGESSILWSVDTLDWKNRSVKETTQRALAGAKPGGIILMHDIHPSTVDAVPGIISGLKERGFTLVSIPDLLGEITPGTTYYSRGNHR